MKKKIFVLLGLIVAVLTGGFILQNHQRASAQNLKAEAENAGFIEYNARDQFSHTQNPNGAWSYGYSTSDTNNTLNLFTFPNDSATAAGCSGGIFEQWRLNNSDQIPQIARHNPAATCSNIPANALFIHPGFSGQRAVVRWTAPVSGTFQLSGSLQRQNTIATTDLKIIKNAATAGETLVFSGSNVSTYQITYNLAVSVQAGDTLDFSVGNGNGSQVSDGSSIVINISQPPTACLTAPANLQVNVPAENSPSDVQSVNTNASLVGDATYTNTGKVGRAFELDGAGDYVRIEDNAAQRPATAVTVEGWFKFDSVSGIVSLAGKPLRNSAFNSYVLYLENGNLKGFFGNNSGQFTRVASNFTPQTGVWHHLAVTYDFSGGVSTLRLYANGVDVTAGQDGTPNLPLFYDANPYPLTIGGEFENNAPAFFLDGQADEVSVYGRALSLTEIFNLVRQGSFGKCPNAPCAQTSQGLVSWYAGEQNALDSRSNNHGTLQNGTTFQTGRVGQGFSFDGVDDYIAVPDSNNLDIPGDLTIEAWVNPAQIQAGSVTLVDKRDSSNNNLNYVLFLVNGELRFVSRSGGGTFDENFSGVTLTAGTFSHVAVTIQNGSLRFYVNGVSSPALTAPATRPATTGRLIIGATETTSLSGFFNGSIDELSIYNRALTSLEISSIVNAGQSGKCKPIATNPAANRIAWFSGDGETADFLGFNPNGILRGDANYRVGRVGQAFNLDGAGDYVEVADDADHRPATQLTAEGWFKINSFGNFPHLIAKGLRGSDRNSYVLWFGNGNIRIGYSDSVSNFIFYDTGFVPNAGEWNHYAIVLNTEDAGANANTFKLYVNGREVYTNTAAGSIYYDTVNPHPLTIGADINNDVPDFSLNGQADEVSLYSRALSASEVAAVYNAETAGKLKEKAVNSIIFTAQLNAKSGKRFNPSNGTAAPATVKLTDATVTFANVTSSGTVSQSGVDLGFLPPLPSNFSFTGLAYDIATTVGYQQGSPDDVQVCFNVPALAANFANLRILHLENGVWVNRTATGNTSPNLCTDNLTSLSPFVIAQALAPTAASVSISGKVTDVSGNGLSGVNVTLTDSQGASVSVRSNNFGRYSFAGVVAGNVYVIRVASKRYQFAVSEQAVNVQDAVENVDFTALPAEDLSPIKGRGK